MKIQLQFYNEYMSSIYNSQKVSYLRISAQQKETNKTGSGKFIKTVRCINAFIQFTEPYTVFFFYY